MKPKLIVAALAAWLTITNTHAQDGDAVRFAPRDRATTNSGWKSLRYLGDSTAATPSRAPERSFQVALTLEPSPAGSGQKSPNGSKRGGTGRDQLGRTLPEGEQPALGHPESIQVI